MFLLRPLSLFRWLGKLRSAAPSMDCRHLLVTVDGDYRTVQDVARLTPTHLELTVTRNIAAGRTVTVELLNRPRMRMQRRHLCVTRNAREDHHSWELVGRFEPPLAPEELQALAP